MNEDRDFTPFVKLCREHNNLTKETMPRMERRTFEGSAVYRIICPVCDRQTEFIKSYRSAVSTWNMIIALSPR